MHLMYYMGDSCLNLHTTKFFSREILWRKWRSMLWLNLTAERNCPPIFNEIHLEVDFAPRDIYINFEGKRYWSKKLTSFEQIFEFGAHLMGSLPDDYRLLNKRVQWAPSEILFVRWSKKSGGHSRHLLFHFPSPSLSPFSAHCSALLTFWLCE